MIDFEKVLQEKLSAETFKVISTSEKEFRNWLASIQRELEKSCWQQNELLQYRKLGTVEELEHKELMSMPKQPVFNDEDFSYYICPKCEELIYYTDRPEAHNYCLNCGQAIDWS